VIVSLVHRILRVALAVGAYILFGHGPARAETAPASAQEPSLRGILDLPTPDTSNTVAAPSNEDPSDGKTDVETPKVARLTWAGELTVDAPPTSIVLPLDLPPLSVLTAKAWVFFDHHVRFRFTSPRTAEYRVEVHSDFYFANLVVLNTDGDVVAQGTRAPLRDARSSAVTNLEAGKTYILAAGFSTETPSKQATLRIQILSDTSKPMHIDTRPEWQSIDDAGEQQPSP
jgi:hypothetical protein